MKRCIVDLNQGGVATGLGDRGQLSVVLKAATPQVKCEASPTKHDLRMRAYCQIVLNGMPTSNTINTFGLRDLHPTVAVPMTFTDGMSLNMFWNLYFISSDDKTLASNRCNITIDINGPPMLARWYDIWGAACSVMGVCVRNHKDGTAIIECRL